MMTAAPAYDGSERDKDILEAWLSLNSFSARLHGAQVYDVTTLAIFALRPALEDKPPSNVSGQAKINAAEARVALACEWFENAGTQLYDAMRTGQDGGLDEATKSKLRVGELADGVPPGLSVERWKFWTGRVEELATEVGNEELRTRADKTVESMKNMES
jgi:hypothetical protein